MVGMKNFENREMPPPPSRQERQGNAQKGKDLRTYKTDNIRVH